MSKEGLIGMIERRIQEREKSLSYVQNDQLADQLKQFQALLATLIVHPWDDVATFGDRYNEILSGKKSAVMPKINGVVEDGFWCNRCGELGKDANTCAGQRNGYFAICKTCIAECQGRIHSDSKGRAGWILPKDFPLPPLTVSVSNGTSYTTKQRFTLGQHVFLDSTGYAVKSGSVHLGTAVG